MLRRLFAGILLGAGVGAAVCAALIGWLKITVFEGTAGQVEAYAAALAVGVLAGLVTGKPIWASDAKVEAGLKAFFGALLAAGGMFALRRWAPPVALPAPVGMGVSVALGNLPVSLAVVGASLGALFELDNTDDGKPSPGQAPARSRVSAGVAARRQAGGHALPSELDEGSPSSASEGRPKRAKG
jgi:hypothetical protein